jgi:hypothetical protein
MPRMVVKVGVVNGHSFARVACGSRARFRWLMIQGGERDVARRRTWVLYETL